MGQSLRQCNTILEVRKKALGNFMNNANTARTSANTANKLPRQARVSNHDHHEQTAVSVLFCFVCERAGDQDAGAAPVAAPPRPAGASRSSASPHRCPALLLLAVPLQQQRAGGDVVHRPRGTETREMNGGGSLTGCGNAGFAAFQIDATIRAFAKTGSGQT
jgi:hypothetical protein